MHPIIEFKNFSFKYRAQTEPTLQEIDLTIRRGEKILVTGVSGSGKSTLAHCINGLIPCSFKGDCTGSLTVAGLVPAEQGVFGMAKKVGTVLQDTDGQFIGMTVAEDLAFALENDAVPQQEIFKKVDQAAELVGMKAFLNQSPSELSGGQKQRVSLGGVLVDDVEILLFDEPLANLDPATGKRTIALIDEILKEKDLTVLIVEHRVEDVLYRDVDRIIVMNEGQIAADMAPDDLLGTDILPKMGIREPLYVTAVKHALDYVYAEEEKAAKAAAARLKAAKDDAAENVAGAQAEAKDDAAEKGAGTLAAEEASAAPLPCPMKIDPKDRPQHIENMNLAPYREAVRKWFRAKPLPERVNENETVLEVRNLSFAYEENKNVLENISFAVRKGEMLSIVGKNGAGKSTLSSLICGFYKPDEGQILLHGEDISPLSIKERGEKIGFVMQSPNQMISKPVIKEEVELGLRVRGVPEEEISERSMKIMDICGIRPMRNWPVGAVSFGQKKRVSIASILVMDPEILILDEPTAGQDFRHYTEIMEFLRMLNRTMGLTIILITHDMHLMLEYTDRAIVLADGHLLTDDTPAKVLTDPETADKAALKKTSLYDLALGCGIEEPYQLVERFIDYERSAREEAISRRNGGAEAQHTENAVKSPSEPESGEEAARE